MESARFDEYVDTCAKYDVVPDFVKYSEGREGREYRSICSGTSEERFLEGHLLGYNVHSTEETIQDTSTARYAKEPSRLGFGKLKSTKSQIDCLLELWIGIGAERTTGS